MHRYLWKIYRYTKLYYFIDIHSRTYNFIAFKSFVKKYVLQIMEDNIDFIFNIYIFIKHIMHII